MKRLVRDEAPTLAQLRELLDKIEARAQEGRENIEDVTTDSIDDWIDPVLALADEPRAVKLRLAGEEGAR